MLGSLQHCGDGGNALNDSVHLFENRKKLAVVPVLCSTMRLFLLHNVN